MNYIEYIKDFDNLMVENEKVYMFRQIFETNIEDYIEFYYSD